MVVGFLALGLVGNHGLGGEDQAADAGGVLQRGARHLGGVNDSGFHQVAVLAGGGVEAVVLALAAHDLVDDHAALKTSVGGNLTGGFLEGAHDDASARGLVTVELVRDLLDSGNGAQQGHATTGHHAFLDGGTGGGEGVLVAVLLFLQFRFGGCTDANHGDTAGQLGKALLELFLGVIAVGALEFLLDGVDAGVNLGFLAEAVNDGGFVLGDADALGPTEHAGRGVLELEAEFFSDQRAASDGCDVLEHFLAAITEAGGLHSRHVQRAAQFVHDQRGERLAIHVFGDDQQRAACLSNRLEDGQQIFEGADLLFNDQDVGFFQHDFHAVGVVDEVRADVALVELHAFNDVHLGIEALGFLDGDDAFLANLLHRVCNLDANGFLVGGDAGDFLDGFAVVDRHGQFLDGFDGGLNGLVDAALQGKRVGSGHDVAQALADDGLTEHGGGGGAVTRDVVGLAGDLDQELRADVLELVFEFDFLGDGDAVLGDRRAAELLFEDDIATLRAECDLDGVGDGVDAALKGATGVFIKSELLGHGEPPGNRVLGLEGCDNKRF